MSFLSHRGFSSPGRDACPECMIARLLLLVFVVFVIGMAWATWDWLPVHHLGSWFGG